jgi:hypothetical protein
VSHLTWNLPRQRTAAAVTLVTTRNRRSMLACGFESRGTPGKVQFVSSSNSFWSVKKLAKLCAFVGNGGAGKEGRTSKYYGTCHTSDSLLAFRLEHFIGQNFSTTSRA